jgi:hypothetical protein
MMMSALMMMPALPMNALMMLTAWSTVPWISVPMAVSLMAEMALIQMVIPTVDLSMKTQIQATLSRAIQIQADVILIVIMMIGKVVILPMTIIRREYGCLIPYI